MPKATTASAASTADSSGLNGCWVLTEAHLGGLRLPDDRDLSPRARDARA
jgi:hypothetical protein